MTAPEDWGVFPDASSGLVTWGAAGEAVPGATLVHELDVPSTMNEVPQDSARSGFVPLSPCAAGDGVRLYALGYNHISVEPPDDTASYARIPPWREDSVSGLVLGPGDCTEVHDWGNRRPEVDGFAGLVNDPGNRTGLAADAPVTVRLRFARSGEADECSTLRVSLKREDVTAAFRTNSMGDGVAVFEAGASPLAPRRNVLRVSVDGVVAGTDRTAGGARPP